MHSHSHDVEHKSSRWSDEHDLAVDLELAVYYPEDGQTDEDDGDDPNEHHAEQCSYGLWSWKIC